jgi:hypothetical protein
MGGLEVKAHFPEPAEREVSVGDCERCGAVALRRRGVCADCLARDASAQASPGGAAVLAELVAEPSSLLDRDIEYQLEWGYTSDLGELHIAVAAACRSGWRPLGPLVAIREPDGDVLVLRELVRARPSTDPAALPEGAATPMEPAQPADPEEAETWIEDLPPEEAQTTREVQARVSAAVREIASHEAAEWLSEETLWQIATLLAETGRISLPEVGTLEVVDTASGPALLATASPCLRRRPPLGRRLNTLDACP